MIRNQFFITSFSFNHKQIILSNIAKFSTTFFFNKNINHSNNRKRLLSSVSNSRISRERPPPIKVTPNATKRLKELLRDKDVSGIRLSVKRSKTALYNQNIVKTHGLNNKGGCNGYSYTMNYASNDENSKKDEVVTTDGIKVFVDPKAIFFLAGTEMDFTETELSSEFTFLNPNSKGKCGCGESFNV